MSSQRPKRHHRAYTDDVYSSRNRDERRSNRPHPDRSRYDDMYDLRPPPPDRRRTTQDPRQDRYARYDSPPPSRRDQYPRERPRRHYDSDDEYLSPGRHHRGDKDYYSDDAYSRSRPHPRDQRPPPRDRYRSDYDDRRLERRSKSGRRESKWQKEAKDLFEVYAIPVIKKEGAKFVTKQVQKMLNGRA